MSWFVQIVGAGIVLLALIDVFFTVLYPRSGRGILSVPLSRGIWRLFRCLATTAIPRHKDQLLSYAGPTIIIAIVVTWVLLLLIGFALVFWSSLGSAVQASEGATPTDFITALYFSGYSLTTLGVGDIVPKTNIYKLLVVLEAVIGFSVLTLTLTFLQSVYSAFISRNTFALSLHHRTVRTGDAAEMLARLGLSGDFSSAHQEIDNMAKGLINLLESHHSYPVLNYFRFRAAYYALPRMTFLTMDTATLIKSALNEEKYRSFVHSTVVEELWGGGLQLLMELLDSFLPGNLPEVMAQSEIEWRERYIQVVERLNIEGIATAPDIEAGVKLYSSLRRQWEPYVVALANYMAYEWSKTIPASKEGSDSKDFPLRGFNH